MEAKEKIESFLKGVKVWSFNVKFNTTETNVKTFEQFKEFCKTETDNNYLLGIKYLLDFYETDFKYNSLYELITSLQKEVNSLKQELKQIKEVKNEKPKAYNTFGN